LIDLPPGILVSGAIIGTTYGLLAIGLILAYRSSGVINFALGNVGGVASAVMGRLSLSLGLPWLVVFPIALAAGSASAAALEIGVMRRLRRAPRVMAIVATLGAAQLLLGLASSITRIRSTALFPPPFNVQFHIGSLLITPYYVLILILSPIVVAALMLFLSPPDWLPKRLRSRHGTAMRAAADNPDAARTAGISPDAMSAIAWTISGALASFTAILMAPARGFQTIDSLGPELLVRALAPAVIASMGRLPLALVAGIGIGVFESAGLWLFNSSAVVDGGLFVIVLIGLLVRRRGVEVGADSSWLTLPHDRPLPERLKSVWIIRNLGRVTALAALGAAALLPLLISNERASIFVSVLTLACIGLSITVVSGIAGQISLGQFAVAGTGALVSYLLFVRMDVPWLLAVIGGAAAGGAASLVIGLPALRLRGLLLAATSLAFALMAPSAIFGSVWAFGTGVDPGRALIGGREVVTVRAYYYIALITLAVCSWLVYNLKRGGIGRLLVGIRDNEDVARAFGINATGRKLQGFVVSGLIAGLGGVIYAQSLSRLNIETFPAGQSVSLLAIVVLGGISKVSGAILGAAYLVGLPLLINLSTVRLMVTGVGVLVFVLYIPGGLAQLLDRLRWVVTGQLARRTAHQMPEAETRSSTLSILRLKSERDTSGGPILAATEVTVSYDHVTALTQMSLEINEGETLGIIGPNGSGKTTLFKVLSGFTGPQSGRVLYEGHDITGLAPEERARSGLVRSFQDSMLFPTLTVADSIRLALESRAETRIVSSMLGLPPAMDSEREKELNAKELIELLGLHAFRDKLVGELSTGTRRITELACMIALRPRVLLLDEPSSGIAQRETEALGELLKGIKARLGSTLAVIEHDMPLVMGLSDRIVAMSAGTKIAEGTPAEVQSNSDVIESYLGTKPAVIARSGRA
jgi:ABC-type branched-subunit amino acid transport system ATPase component/ABC-type branched-subunit amino acid transport system permease subunit